MGSTWSRGGGSSAPPDAAPGLQPGRPRASLVAGVLMVFLFLLLSNDPAQALRCWHCIGDDCDKDPHQLDHAKPRQCRAGEACQKVYYRVKAAKMNVILESTTRTCSSGPCLERNDFINCTTDNVENPGCMRQYCCNDSDMCNAAAPSWNTRVIVAVSLVVVFVQDLMLLLIGGG